jgi:hypothetical protein
VNLINTTKMVAGYTMATAPDGRESFVVVVKGTYIIPERAEQEPVLADEQMPLVMCDEFTGEPGFSAIRYEIDFAPHKPHCDVLLNGSAYSPQAKPTDRVTVSLSVGTLTKSFDVVGNRKWQAGILMTTYGDTEPFTVMPISYDNAFGGVDRSQEDESKHCWYPLNHAGVGYYYYTNKAAIDGKPLPNTEETGRAINNSSGSFKPMAFGPIGRAWQDRIKWAGTYDKKWLDEKFPFLPDDFDYRYFQSTPEDQQMNYLRGGEPVELTNLTARGHTKFELPKDLSLPVVFLLRTGEIVESFAKLDTLLLEPDRGRFMLTWRAAQPIQRTVKEIQRIVAGRTAREWEDAELRLRRQSGKQRLASLAELSKSK